MYLLTVILAATPLVVAIIAAYYFADYISEMFDIHSTFVVGVIAIAFGVFVWWVVATYVLPAIAIGLGLDKIPYQP
ncbi:MAG: hypothetical protein IJ113_02950 [Eggerthellaceae bacterium]|nr:hypothetical protein [Eggerthellaceae bacterium]